ncbi:hypothetical protein OG871_32400 [Kitasatospora sp. NBC_00374]|uniref:immunity protein Imm33 domain-containing protein n=1 Tax=Kitasatospora sp. NBC_00374 TaxID=2975964 RepID=UPI0030DE8366
MLHDHDSVCSRFGAEPAPVDGTEILGLAENFSSVVFPINGLRQPAEDGACGWFVWSSEELSDDPDLFVPTPVGHLVTVCPSVLPYLALPPGWRFLIGPGYEDVWYDEQLLHGS